MTSNPSDHSSAYPLKGACFCGSVSFALASPPVMRAYCHCTNCQRLTACPLVHTIHNRASSFSWTHDAPHESKLDSFDNPLKPWKRRWRCKVCGTNVASHNSKTDNWSVWGALLERDQDGKIRCWEEVKPTAHIFYDTRMLDVGDELGKWDGYEDKSRRIA